MESLWRLNPLGFLPWLLWLELPKLSWVKVVSVGMLWLSCSCPLICSCCGTDWGTLSQLQICCMGQTLSPRASQGWPSMDLCWVFSAWHGSVLVSYLALCFPLGTNLWLYFESACLKSWYFPYLWLCTSFCLGPQRQAWVMFQEYGVSWTKQVMLRKAMTWGSSCYRIKSTARPHLCLGYCLQPESCLNLEFFGLSAAPLSDSMQAQTC